MVVAEIGPTNGQEPSLIDVSIHKRHYDQMPLSSNSEIPETMLNPSPKSQYYCPIMMLITKKRIANKMVNSSCCQEEHRKKP